LTIPDLRRFNAPEKLISWILSNSTFWGDGFFLNYPTLAPQGSRLTLTIRFHEKLWNSVKDVTLGT
jgi:hypothetical protein